MQKIVAIIIAGVASPLAASGAIAADFDLELEAGKLDYSYNPGAPSPFDAAFFGNTEGALKFTSASGKLFSTTGLSQIGVTTGDNIVIFDGAGSNWEGENHLYIGVASSNNSLTVQNGANVDFGIPIAVVSPTAADIILGYDDGGDDNSLTVTGAATTFTTDGTIYVGRNGDDNSLTIEDGAVVTSLQGRIGGGTGSTAGATGNSVTIDGNGSKWQMSGTLRIGAGGTSATGGNTVTVRNGGGLSTGKTIQLGRDTLSDGNELTITGEGSNVTSAEDLYLGWVDGSTDNLVTVDDLATLDVAGTLLVRDDNTLSLASGAAVTAGTLTLTAAADPKEGSHLSFDIDTDNLATLTVTNGATLGGAFKATFSGALENRVDIINASLGFAGTTFDTVDTTDLARGFAADMVYGLPKNPAIVAPAGTAYLDIDARLGRIDTLGRNQHRVAEGLNTSFNGGQSFSKEFVSIYALENPELQAALTELSGEANAYGLSSGVSNSDASMLQILRNQALAGGRGGWGAFANSQGAADGNQAEGTHDTDTSRSTFAGGLTMGGDALSAGLGVAVGQSDWDLAGLGAGGLDSVQFGGFLKADLGNAYIGATGVIGRHDMAVSRDSYRYVPPTTPFAPLPDEVLGFASGVASNAMRLEAGYTLALSDALSVTPYAAYATGQSVLKNATSENGSEDAIFGLTYEGQTIHTRTTEFGTRIDGKVGDATQLFAGVAVSSSDSDAVHAHFTGLENSGFDLVAAGSGAVLTKVELGASYAVADSSTASLMLTGTFGEVSEIGVSTGLRINW